MSSPRVMTATNTKALVEVIEEIPYVKVTATTTTGTTTGSGSSVQEEVEFKQTGITMEVTPIIQGDGLVEITIDQTVSDVVEFFNDVPVIDRQHLSTTFLVADGQTAVMGGLMQDRRRSVNEGVPLLGKIPVIGWLFRKDEDVTEKRELLIFVTPRILDPLQAAQVAKRYKQSYREQREQFKLPMLDEESATSGQVAEAE
ncbi:MAG: type II secretory pathway component GspD/PulD (secretin) [Planctomycetota bacterium]